MDNEMFKLVSRRYLAWGFVGIATLVISFIAVYGTLTAQTELVTMAAGGLLTEIGAVIGFYFSKKVSEE
jgi:hypothetical protein